MGGFQKFEPAEFDEGNVAAAELDLEQGAVMAGTKEDRLLLERRALFAVGEHALANELGLRRIVAYGNEGRLVGRMPLGPEVLREAFFGKRDYPESLFDVIALPSGIQQNGARRLVW
jgi:hypothetical protein